MNVLRGEFRHEALFYEDRSAFLRGTLDFVEEAVDQGAPVLVMVSPVKGEALRSRLGASARHVQFADMERVGRNPARIIPAWRDFAARHPGAPLRGIGEPVWSERASAALDEAQRHEQLLNLAFADAAHLSLLCPYDTRTLNASALAEAQASHDHCNGSTDYLDVAFGGTLPDPPDDAVAFRVNTARLRDMRDFVRDHALENGLGPARTADWVLAIGELATNSIRYGDGKGAVLVWRDGSTFVCELRDAGRVTDPLVGRRRPRADRLDGRGLWIANQLCDLVQIRSGPAGTRVRITMSV
jgi:anti-sigma regulatory factor (Ser/Thr protein kinase)